MNRIGPIKDKNILLLQGPIGYFFKKLGKVFSQRGAHVFRIGLNAGDAFFSSRQRYQAYKGTQEAWYDYIYHFLKTKKIDKIFIFGDCRFYQSVAIAACEQLSIEVFVFEEGYLRPHYVTLEKHGVNDYSHISRDPTFYKKIMQEDIPEPLYSTPHPTIIWGVVMIYYLISKIFYFRYPYYQHHRSFSAIHEFVIGIRSLVRKLYYKKRDNRYLSKIQNGLSKKYFFVPLQTHNDFQILQHSGYGTIEKFIIEVLESFSKNTKSEYMILKHHPIDRGRKNYSKFILEQAIELGIEKRVIVVHDLHLPTILEHAKGTITINSTVGLSSIFYGTPTITLGKAIYDIDGLTNKDVSLESFWVKCKIPNKGLSKSFKQYLLQTTQLNGHFYGRFPIELTDDNMYL